MVLRELRNLTNNYWVQARKRGVQEALIKHLRWLPSTRPGSSSSPADSLPAGLLFFDITKDAAELVQHMLKQRKSSVAPKQKFVLVDFWTRESRTFQHVHGLFCVSAG